MTTFRTRLISATLSVVLVLLVTSCGDDGPVSADESLRELNVSDTPAQVLTAAVQRLGPDDVIGAELGRDYLQLKYALRGYSWADAACAVERTVEIVTPDAFAQLTAVRLDDIPYDFPAVGDAARTCASPESLARLDAGKDTTTTTGADAGGLESSAPDIDGAVVGTMLEAFYRISADGIGMTETEIGCIVEGVFGDRSAAGFVDLAVGDDELDGADTEKTVMGCLTDRRVDELAPVAATELLERKEASAADRRRVQALIDAEAERIMSSSTTIAPASS